MRYFFLRLYGGDGGIRGGPKSNCRTLVGFPFVIFHWIKKKIEFVLLLPISTTYLRSDKIRNLIFKLTGMFFNMFP